MLRRLLLVLLACSLLAAVVLRIGDRELPAFERGFQQKPVGSFHVHSEASHDSELTLEELTRSASEVGLDFIVVTDHNHQLAGPVIVNDVVVLSYAEVSTPFGHLIQLGGRDVPAKGQRGGMDLHQRLRALGVTPILSHPTDTKRPWSGPIEGIGGLEIANLSSASRRRGGPLFVGLLPSLAAYRLNPTLALAQVYDRDVRALARWDAESDPEVIGMCGNDAHGRLIDVGLNLRGWLTVLETELPSEPSQKPAALLDAIVHGRFHCVAGLLGTRPLFRFAAMRKGDVIGEPGATLTTDAVDALVVSAPRVTGVAPTIVLLRNGEAVARQVGIALRYSDPAPGTYRAEVRVALPNVLGGVRVVPAIYSNRIRVALPAASPLPAGDPPSAPAPLIPGP